MLRLSRSHDQNRRRAGETADKAATPAVQRDVLKQKKRSRGRVGGGGVLLLTDTESTKERAGVKKSCVGRKASSFQPV